MTPIIHQQADSTAPRPDTPPPRRSISGAKTTDFDALNTRLAEISERLYGARLQLRIVNPRTLLLMKKNARFMAKEMFDQLVRNLSADGQMESTPLCHTLADGRLEVVSGNHRVQAAIKAGLVELLVMVIPSELKPGMKRAKQLSHNAIQGSDDQHVLIELWQEIDDIEAKLYSGLDSRVLGELAKVTFAGFGPEQIRTEQVVLWFLPEEIESLDAVLNAMQTLAASRRVYLAPLGKYEELFKRLVAKKRSDNIKNTAVAFMALIDELTAHAKSIPRGSQVPEGQA